MSPRPLKEDEVLAIHAASLERFGGLAGVRDKALLESAIAQPFQTFDGLELYPTIAEKAARYAYGLCRNHPFMDGNKRTATACMAAFLRINGQPFKPNHKDLLEVMLATAEGSITYEKLVQWVKEQLE